MPADDHHKPAREPNNRERRHVEKPAPINKGKAQERDSKTPSHDSFDDIFMRIGTKRFWPVAAATSSALRHDRFKTPPRD